MHVYLLYAQYIAPGPVIELSYEVMTNTSVKVTWKPPEGTDGDIVSYFVEHGEYQKGSNTSVEVDVHTIIHDMGKLLLYYIECIVSTYCINPCSAKGPIPSTPFAHPPLSLLLELTLIQILAKHFQAAALNL